MPDEARRRFIAAVDEDRGDNRLAGVGEIGGIFSPAAVFFALGQDQIVAKVQIPSDAFQRLAPDQRAKAPSQFTLAFTGILCVQHFGHHEAKHAVTEKFKPLIGMDIARDGTRMHERAGEQLAILKAIKKLRLEFFGDRLNLFRVNRSFGVGPADH